MEKSVGIFDGNFAVRDKEKNYILQDKEIYLPKVIKRIDELLNKNGVKIQISNIIFQAIKDTFGIENLFVQPGYKSIVPDSDPLYECLFNYVKNNPSYIMLKENSYKKKVQDKLNRKRYYANSVTFTDYVNQSRTKYINDRAKKGYH